MQSKVADNLVIYVYLAACFVALYFPPPFFYLFGMVAVVSVAAFLYQLVSPLGKACADKAKPPTWSWFTKVLLIGTLPWLGFLVLLQLYQHRFNATHAADTLIAHVFSVSGEYQLMAVLCFSLLSALACALRQYFSYIRKDMSFEPWLGKRYLTHFFRSYSNGSVTIHMFVVLAWVTAASLIVLSDIFAMKWGRVHYYDVPLLALMIMSMPFFFWLFPWIQKRTVARLEARRDWVYRMSVRFILLMALMVLVTVIAETSGLSYAPFRMVPKILALFPPQTDQTHFSMMLMTYFLGAAVFFGCVLSKLSQGRTLRETSCAIVISQLLIVGVIQGLHLGSHLLTLFSNTASNIQAIPSALVLIFIIIFFIRKRDTRHVSFDATRRGRVYRTTLSNYIMRFNLIVAFMIAVHIMWDKYAAVVLISSFGLHACFALMLLPYNAWVDYRFHRRVDCE